MVNDVSGLSDVEVADACAEAGARAGDHAHARAAQGQGASPTTTTWSPTWSSCCASARALAVERGVGEERLIFDPGIDIAKSPAESIEVLRRLPEVAELGRPLLVAVSRKDFVGALTGRAPGRARRRDAGRRGHRRRRRGGHPAGARRRRARATTWRCATRWSNGAARELQLDPALRREPV